MNSQKVHLVFSGGGVRCFSYIGALQKLAENNITISSVSACSMGSVLGVLACSGLNPQEVEAAIINFNFKSLKTEKAFSLLRYLKYPFASHYTPDYCKIITALLGKDPLLGELKIPFSALALDLRQRRFLVYSSGTHPDMKVSEVLTIATAIPLLYEPYKLGKYLLVDAAVASDSPVWMAAANPGNYPILVLKPVAAPNEDYKKSFPRFLSYLFNASTSSHDHFTFSQSARSVNIDINCSTVSYDDFNLTKEKIEGMILQGQTAMEQKLKEFNYSFERIFEIEEIGRKVADQSHENKAAALASEMQLGYQKEILNRSQVFVSYSRNDKKWLTKLQTYLKSVERFTGIKTWDDTLISRPSKSRF